VKKGTASRADYQIKPVHLLASRAAKSQAEGEFGRAFYLLSEMAPGFREQGGYPQLKEGNIVERKISGVRGTRLWGRGGV